MAPETRTHGKYSPSQLERVAVCKGSIRECERGAIEVPSEYGSEGDLAHELAATALARGERRALDVACTVLPFSLMPIDKDMCNGVQLYLDYVFEAASQDPGAQIIVEQKVHVPTTMCNGEADGHSDCLVYLPTLRRLYVIDFKYGAGIAKDVEGNLQLLSYGTGAVFGGTISPSMVDEVVLCIVQPRAFHKFGPIRDVTVTVGELVDHGTWLNGLIDECENQDQPLTPGEEQCRFCPANATCKAFENAALATMMDVPNVQHVHALPDPAHLSLDRLSHVLSAKSFVSLWFNRVEETATHLAKLGYQIPGMKLVEPDARRQWHENDDSIARKLAVLSGLTYDDFMPRKLLSITEAEKLLVDTYRSKVKGKTKKNNASKNARHDMAFLTVKMPSSNTKLVTEDHASPAVSPATHFSHVKLIGDVK